MALPEMPGRKDDVERRARYEREELLAISRALSSERDIRKLLDLILLKGRQLTGADAGSVYVVEPSDAGAAAGAPTDGARWRSRAVERDAGGEADGNRSIPGRASQAK